VPPAERRRLVWDRGRDDLAVEVVRHLDGVELAVRHERPAPGPATTEALLDHVARHGLGVLGWTAAGRAARDRLAFLHRHRPEEWPDVGDDALAASLAEWLGPMLPAATGRADLAAVDPGALLVARLDHARRRDLDRSAPRTVALPSGRDARLDYSSGAPVLAVAPQELFGSTEHPCVLDGAVPVVLELVSPAGRPVQVTSDLAGFWAGSWAEVRKEMAGRYPKHPWPVDPATAEPPRRHRRPR
jgi:ATP-dependent helicase HrpB